MSLKSILLCLGTFLNKKCLKEFLRINKIVSVKTNTYVNLKTSFCDTPIIMYIV